MPDTRQPEAAAQFPTLNANGSYTRQKASDVGVFSSSPSALGANGASGSTTGGIGGGHLDAFDVYQAGFDASWEVDLWGRVRRSVEFATASVVASAEARRGRTRRGINMGDRRRASTGDIRSEPGDRRWRADRENGDRRQISIPTRARIIIASSLFGVAFIQR